MKKRGLTVAVSLSFMLAFPAMVGAQGETSRTTSPPESSKRSSVPTGDTQADRKAVDEEKSSAPAPRPRVKDGSDGPPVITVPPAAPVGD